MARLYRVHMYLTLNALTLKILYLVYKVVIINKPIVMNVLTKVNTLFRFSQFSLYIHFLFQELIQIPNLAL